MLHCFPMVPEKSLVLYKNRPAMVTEGGEKITLLVAGGETIKVREKDIELLHRGPMKSLGELEEVLEEGDLVGTWELLDQTEVPLSELAELVYGVWNPRTAWAAYKLLRDGLYFTGTIDGIKRKSPEDVAAEKVKREEKGREAAEREAFLSKLKKLSPILPSEQRFIQDVEALAYGKTDKSKTLRDLGRPETPLEAHRILLAIGYWSPMVNPYPYRFSQSLSSAKIVVEAPRKDEERFDLTHLRSFAIDNAWSADPDDAVALEGNTLYVHVADPAAVIGPDSPADLEARNRGATLYLPEGTYRMIAEEALPLFALGLSEVSPALTFKMDLADDYSIISTEILRSWVRVRRLTYQEADEALTPEGHDPSLAGLFAVADGNLKRRLKAGAVSIDFPEVHLGVTETGITITPIKDYRSAAMVRECMLLAGEGTARWAIRNQVPFPFVAQEVGDLPTDPLPGLAGSYQLRRCMRPRRLSPKPGAHGALGLGEYTQVTSPLRRYTDLVCHQQIRSFLTGKPLLSSEEVLRRLAAGEMAAQASVQAERASRSHWTLVYLMNHPNSVWEAVVLDRKGNRATVVIPDLALETQVAIKADAQPNDRISLTLGQIKLPELEVNFRQF